ncbi:glyoxal reductase [Sporosarcina sp. P37]|uniref:aldo/keto reductase n=1 Tax=unclassified Sporosarcina TaxID=2647733 RepID=UPI0009C0EB07|nr:MULTISPECIES: aldo/keto reductase [unclassified Sporosarcina]ARD47674.1 glyoxal reductase [Sporosarcina sp. P33]ARK24203.1 glyoxal reductase [Sporosarcina sp. P37]PID17210.1 aldo/keto reductase [Sporosarcina sp. P35]
MATIFDQMVILSNGVQMPQFGLGTYKMTEPEQTMQAVEKAVSAGYRAIDTASIYANEQVVGEAIRNTGIAREDLFITSKVWNDEQGYDETLRAFERSLTRLDMNYLDLYLTHWPVTGKYVDTYRAIERLYDEKLIRATGVSNHHESHLQEIFTIANISPMVNQVEIHPRLTQESLRQFCSEHQIAVTSWSPLARGQLLEDAVLAAIAAQYDKTIAQVILRWHIQNGLIVIPKSVTLSRIEENSEIADFELTLSDMAMINALHRDERTGSDPDTF